MEFSFKSQLEGGEPSFVKNLREARSVSQIVFSYIVYLWIALGVLIVIFAFWFWARHNQCSGGLDLSLPLSEA